MSAKDSSSAKTFNGEGGFMMTGPIAGAFAAAVNKQLPNAMFAE